MHVTGLTVMNYGPFKSTHAIDLGPTVYGVVGRHDSDAGRSNWLGKSWAMGIIRYALYGAHGASSEDACIHDGESEMAVRVLLDDGTSIKRTRNRGSATQLKVYASGSSKPATQKRAQDLIEQLTKMSLEDFDASCFIKQKQIARMILALPSERTKIVNAWLELGPLQEAAGYASDELRRLMTEKAAIMVTVEADIALHADPNYDDAIQTETIEKFELSLAGFVDLRGMMKDDIAVATQWEYQHSRSLEFDELLVEGAAKKVELAELKAKLAKMRPEKEIEADREVAHSKLHDARAVEQTAVQLAAGKFDGHCPVIDSECFAQGQVVEQRDRTKLRLPQLQSDTTSSTIEHDVATLELAQLHTLELKIENATLELDQIRADAEDRAEANDFVEANEDPGGLEKLRVKEEQYDETIADQKLQLSLARDLQAKWQAAGVAIAAADADLADLDDQIRTAREAITILGRGGAQKEIATSALAEIEGLANGLLTQASIDLSITVKWAREGKGLASHCGGCGAPFGTSARVKACPGCNAPRGPNMVEKLELDVSNRSGAADDMAGLAFQLAASSWLRKKRGSDWSAVFIDEPFGSLDETNSTNLSSHLHAMIQGQFGFEQGFLVAHSPRIMGAMPARVVVGSDGNGSRLGVE